MKSTWELKENSTGQLVVTIAGEPWQQAQNKAVTKLVKDVEVAGFRKGHAPLAIARKQLNDQSILLEAVDSVLQEAYIQGIEEHGFVPVAQPELDLRSLTLDEVVLVYDITVKPAVVLPEDYKDYQIEIAEIEVSEDDVDHQLEHLQQDYAEWEIKEEGQVEEGDTVILDYEGFKDDVAVDGGQAENAELEIGSNSFIPGFEEGLIGLATGESKDLELTFPEEYQAEDLAGADVVFKVTIHEIKNKVYPELDDDFAKMVNEEGVETLEDLKASVRGKLVAEKEEQAQNEAEEALLEKLIEATNIELPDAMVDEEAQQLLQEFQQRLAQQGLTFDLYKQILNQTDEDVLEQVRPDAIKRLNQRLLLEAVADDQKLEATAEEIDQEYQVIADTYQMEVDQVKQMATPDQIGYDVRLKKAYDVLVENHQ